MTTRPCVVDLLERWQDEYSQGRDVSATELSRDVPELLPEVARGVADLRRLFQLAASFKDGEEATKNDAAPKTHAALPACVTVTADALHGLGYELLEELGRGGMGVVCKARDLNLQRLVAVKMLRSGMEASAEERVRFRAEAEAIARLQHPHIVQIFQAGEWTLPPEGAPVPFFVMEYVAGGTLETVARSGKQPPGEVARLVLLLARAVHAAHQAGVIHRDLKPGNVLLAARADEPALNCLWGCPKVSDFGLARLQAHSEARSVKGVALGTPSYMAPEQAEGRLDDIGPATDVWALGVMLYRLLAGRLPFRGETMTEVLLAVCSQEPEPVQQVNSEVPKALALIVQRCLSKQPARRYATAAALADDLKAWLDGVTGDWEPQPALRRKPRTRLLALAAVVLAFLAGAAVWMSRRHSDEPAPVAASSQAFKGWIDLLVSEPNNKQRQLLRLHEPGARPLRPGDEVRVEVALKERPGYPYVLWIDARGKVWPIYPWKDLKWDSRPPRERVVSGTLLLPEDGTVFPIEPSPNGIETLLLLVRETPLPAEDELLALVGDLGEQTSSDREYVRWFENGRLVRDEVDRAPGGRIDPSDPVERTQVRIRQRLGERFAYSRAVSFFNLGQR